MDIDTNSFDKRQSAEKNYNLIAEQYSNEFGTYIEDLDDKMNLNYTINKINRGV